MRFLDKLGMTLNKISVNLYNLPNPRSMYIAQYTIERSYADPL